MKKIEIIGMVILFCLTRVVTGFADDQGMVISPVVSPPVTAPNVPQPIVSEATQVVGTASPENPNILPLDVNKLKTGAATLNIGHYIHLPPFYFSSGNPQPGFGHDIFVEVAKKAGIQNINFVGFDNETDLNAKLRKGKIDVIANAWDLPGMRKQFLLSAPYYKEGGLSFLYFRSAGSFQTVEDLKNHSIGVINHGYAYNYWLPSHGIAKNSMKTFGTIKDLMFALKDGNIDVAVVYYPLAKLAQQQLTDQLASTLVQPINDVYAVRKQDTELQTLLDQAIQTLAADGTLNKIQAQYFEPAVAAQSAQSPSQG